MKKALIFTSLGILLFGGVFLTYAKDNSTSGVYPSKTCDINGDRKIDKADLDELTNLILNGSNVINKNYDFNGDGDVTISDVMYCSAKITENTTENECQGMETANVTHTVNNDIVILKWNDIEGDNVEISIFDPEDETYKTIGNVKIRTKIFKYKIKWQGEQNFKFSNGCKDYYYKVDIYSKQENICDQNNDGEISVSDISLFTKNCSPTNGKYTGDIKKCDINNDGEISVSDLNLFNEKCLNEIMGTNNEDSNATDCNDDEVKSACSSLDNIDKCPDMCKPDGILTNNHTKTVEFNSDEVSRKVVFDGTYHAIKDSNIIGFYIEHDNIDNENCKKNISYNNIEFKLYINGELVASHLNNSGNGITLNSCQYYGSLNFKKTINVKNGDSIKVKIEGRLDNDKNNNYKESLYSYKLGFLGNNKQGTYKIANEDLAPIRIVNNDNDTFNIIDNKNEKTVYLKNNKEELASFTLKPSNGKEGYLSNIVLQGWEDNTNTPINLSKDVKFKIDGVEIDPTDLSTNHEFLYEINKTVSSKGTNIEIISNKPFDGKVAISIYAINNKYNRNKDGVSFSRKTFIKRFEPALVYISKQENKGNKTKYTLGIDKFDDSTKVFNVGLLTSSDCSGSPVNQDSLKYLGEGGREHLDGEYIEAVNREKTQLINSISYTYDQGKFVCISKNDYPDYFRVDGEDRKVYGMKTNSNIGIDETVSKSTNNIEKSYSNEMVDAYNFAYENGITTKESIEKAKMNSTLTRIAMAKMLSNYAINVLGMEPDTSKGIIEFKDVSKKQNSDYNNAVTLSYQLGIMGINLKSKKFRPNDEVTKGEFATALSRMVYNTENTESDKEFYKQHMKKLYDEGIIDSTENPNSKQLRGDAMIMLMRSKVPSKMQQCDMNHDGKLNEDDIEEFKSNILNGANPINLRVGDINNDGEITVTDLQLCVSIIK